MWAEILAVILLFIFLIKSWIWKQNFLAALLYYAESGCDLPDKATLEKYRMKVIKKSLHIKED